MARSGRSSEYRQIFPRPNSGMDRQDGRTILHGTRASPVASKFLGKIRPFPGSARFEPQENNESLVLAYRPGKRHSFLAKHRAKFALVFHCAPRARARPLLRSLLAPGGPLLVANWSRARIP